MELRFRPDDGYCKPACGDRHQTAGFLLRIRIKKSRKEKLEKSASQVDDKLEKEAKSNGTNSNDSSQNDKKNKSTNCAEEKTRKNLTDKITSFSVKQESSPTATNNHNEDSEKNKSPTFDRKKYENLADDQEYELPKLKVLGRVDTEFRFTSKFISNIYFNETIDICTI